LGQVVERGLEAELIQVPQTLDRHFVFRREENGAGQVFGRLGLDGAAVAAGGGRTSSVSMRVQEDVIEEGVFVMVGDVVGFDDGGVEFAELLVGFWRVRFGCL
jgi:hypothetical protein